MFPYDGPHALATALQMPPTVQLSFYPFGVLLRRHTDNGGCVEYAVDPAQVAELLARKPIWSVREAVSTHSRQVYNWNPLHAVSTEEVWEMLGVTQPELQQVRREVQQVLANGDSVENAIARTRWPWHPAYALGNTRLSCSLCVLASRNDLLNGAQHHPQHYRDLVDLEIASGYSFRQGLWLADLRPDLLTDRQREGMHNLHSREIPKPIAATKPARPVQLCMFD